MTVRSVGLSTGTKVDTEALGLWEDELGQLCASLLSTLYPPEAAGLTVQAQGDMVPRAQSRGLAPSHVRAGSR